MLVIAEQLSGLNPGEGPFAWAAYTMPITFAPFFVLGLIIHRIQVRSSPLYLPAALVAVLCIFGYSLVLPLNYMRGGSGFLLLSCLSAFAVFAAYNSLLPAWLGRAAIFMGEISYSLYLTHWIAYNAVGAVFSRSVPGWAFGLIFMIVAMMLAYLHRIFERPTQDFLRKRSLMDWVQV